jgi:hypothetical protein
MLGQRTEIVRPLGDLWVAGEASGIMGGDESIP